MSQLIKLTKLTEKVQYLHAHLMNRRVASQILFKVVGQMITLMGCMGQIIVLCLFLYLFGKLKLKA